MTSLSITEATEADMPRLMEIQFSAFDGEPFARILFGPNTASARAAACERALEELRSDPHQLVVKAVNNATGEILAFGRWEIYETERPESEWKHREPFEYLEGRQREIGEYFYGRFYEGRERFWRGKPYVLLAFLATHRDCQGQGAGTAIVRWGMERARELGLSVYLESTRVGKPLYDKSGFRTIGEAVMEKEKWDGDSDRVYPLMVWGKGPEGYEQ
ncbi:MAG: hypothetical protein M1816_000975 [Peltula sp. TS41687]|nr:MAG: hypothetical protein M1816_000975 [Peltula sp. TS41687]